MILRLQQQIGKMKESDSEKEKEIARLANENYEWNTKV
jgi:hypothetical protein